MNRPSRPPLAAAFFALSISTVTACGGDSAALSTHVQQYCASLAPSLRLAANGARRGSRWSVGVGPIGPGLSNTVNRHMHFCAGARQGWGDPAAPPMASAQEFSVLADRLDALLVRYGAERGDDAVAGLLDEMATVADDVSEMPLR